MGNGTLILGNRQFSEGDSSFFRPLILGNGPLILGNGPSWWEVGLLGGKWALLVGNGPLPVGNGTLILGSHFPGFFGNGTFPKAELWERSREPGSGKCPGPEVWEMSQGAGVWEKSRG